MSGSQGELAVYLSVSRLPVKCSCDLLKVGLS